MSYTRDSSNFPRRKLDSKIFRAYKNGSQLINVSLQKEWNAYTAGRIQNVSSQIAKWIFIDLQEPMCQEEFQLQLQQEILQLPIRIHYHQPHQQ